MPAAGAVSERFFFLFFYSSLVSTKTSFHSYLLFIVALSLLCPFLLPLSLVAFHYPTYLCSFLFLIFRFAFVIEFHPEIDMNKY